MSWSQYFLYYVNLIQFKVVDYKFNVLQEIKALKTEIEVLQDLDNDRIVKYYGCCEDNLQLSIFMEYMPGVGLLQIYYFII